VRLHAAIHELRFRHRMRIRNSGDIEGIPFHIHILLVNMGQVIFYPFSKRNFLFRNRIIRFCFNFWRDCQSIKVFLIILVFFSIL